MTGITEGNESAFTDKLERWVDPWFNSSGYQEQQISIHLVKHTRFSDRTKTEQMDSHLHIILITKLTRCSSDSECEHRKCQFNYSAFIPFKAIMAECKGSESSHIKVAKAIRLENNDQSSTGNFKNAVLLVINT